MSQLNEVPGGTQAHQSQLEAKYGNKIDNLHLTGDGKIDRTQLLNLLSENDKTTKRTNLLAGTLMLLLALTVAALAWATAGLVTKVSTETTTAHGALVDKGSTSSALRVAPGVVALQVAANSTLVPATLPMKNGGNAIYVGSIDKENVLQACRLLLGGSRQFTTLIPQKADNNITQASTVEVSYANTTACQNAIETGNVDRVAGTVKLDGQQLLYVTCRAATGCHSYQFEASTPSKNATSGKNRRALLSAIPHPRQRSGRSAMDSTRGLLQSSAQAPSAEAPDLVSYVMTPENEEHLTDGAADAASDASQEDEPETIGSATAGEGAIGGDTADVAADAADDAADGTADALDVALEGMETAAEACFPRMATVQLHDGTQKHMHQLVPGDHVLSVDFQGQTKYSPIYVLAHDVPRGMFNYRKFIMETTSENTTDNKINVFEASPDHYMLLSSQNHVWSTRRAVKAADVHVGDHMWVSNKDNTALEVARVLAIEDILDEGMYAPLTLTGTIVVDGVAASVYSAMLGSETNMHVFCAWGRWLYTIWPQFFVKMHQLKWASPMAMNIGYVAKAALNMASLI